jgi:hypothetical protein
MLKNIIKQTLSEKEGYEMPGELKISLVGDSDDESTSVEFIGNFRGIKVCSGRFLFEKESFFHYWFACDTKNYEKTFYWAGKLSGFNSKDWRAPLYPPIPEKFDGNSLRDFFHQTLSAYLKVPLQSKLLLVDQNFRCLQNENSGKISAPRYRIEISFLGTLIFYIDLARGAKTTFIQNTKDSNVDFVPADFRTINQFKNIIIRTGINQFTPNDEGHHSVFDYAEALKVAVESGVLNLSKV